MKKKSTKHDDCHHKKRGHPSHVLKEELYTSDTAMFWYECKICGKHLSQTVYVNMDSRGRFKNPFIG